MMFTRLTVWIRDRSRDRLTLRSFHQSPVTIGGGGENVIRLEASGVARVHGAFLFDDGVLRYVDFGSGSGSRLDGALLPSNVPVEIAEESFLAMGPFVLRAELQSLDAPE